MDKDEALNTLAKVFHNGEEMEGDDGAVMVVDLALWNEGCEAIEALIGGEEDTGECSSCKHAATPDTLEPCKSCFKEMSTQEVMAKSLALARHQLQNYTGRRCPFFCTYCGDKNEHA